MALLELQLIPGLFSDGGNRLLESLDAGTANFRWRGELAGPTSEELRSVDAGDSRSQKGYAVLMGSRPFRTEVESFGASPSPRRLVGIKIDPPLEGELGATPKDLEIALLGLACSALASEDQGAAILGTDLGPIGVGIGRGTVAEQLENLLRLHGESISVLVTTLDTAAGLGPIPEFAATPLGDLREFRRV